MHTSTSTARYDHINQGTFNVTVQTIEPSIIKVAALSPPREVGASIAGQVREHGFATVRAIGASAVNQAVKSVAVANTYWERDGLRVGVVPHFETVQIDGAERTCVVFEVVVMTAKGKAK
jgi:stage V sporulation protein S